MYINYEKLANILGFGKDFFYKLKVKQNLAYIKKNQKYVKDRLKNKSVLNVFFYVYDETKWKSQSVYNLMSKDEHFNPVIIVTKNCCNIKGNPNCQNIEDVENCYKFFKNKGMNVEYGYDIKNDKFISLEKILPYKPDIIIYSHPWYVYKTQGPVMCSKYALTYYIPYFIPASETWIDCNLRFHQYVYKHYVITDLIKDLFSTMMDNKGSNLQVVGHPILDFFYLNKTKQEDKKYIIYAPHWTVCGNNLRFGTFDWNGKEILEFAKKHSELNWVFRPHPLFYKFALSSNFMTKNELDNYFEEWEKIGLISSEGNYMDLFSKSYALITDCGSFLTEYFVSENPVIHLISEKFHNNSTTKEIDETYYTARNLEEVYNHLKEVILNKNDYMEEKRIELLEKFNLKNNYSAKRIVQDILNEIDN